MGDVIRFTGEWRGKNPPPATVPINDDEAMYHQMAIEVEHTQNAAQDVFNRVIDMMKEHGFLNEPENLNTRDVLALGEFIQAIMLREYGHPHPMQNLVDKIRFSPIQTEEGVGMQLEYPYEPE